MNNSRMKVETQAATRWFLFGALSVVCSAEPLTTAELKTARELYTNRGCAGCHQYAELTKAPKLEVVSEKYTANKDGLALMKKSLTAGSVGKWGQVATPPQAHLQGAERELLARWMIGLHASGEKPSGATGELDDFSSPPGIDRKDWAHFAYHGTRSTTIEWSRDTEDLRLSKTGSDAVAGLHRKGRAPGDPVTLTVKRMHAEGKPWAQVGLMISCVPQPQLLGAQTRYEWMLRRESGGPGWVYRVRKDVGSGSYELYSSKPVDPSVPVRFDISRNGDNYEFRANGVLHYITGDNPSDTYSAATRDTMVYFGVTFGGSGAKGVKRHEFTT